LGGDLWSCQGSSKDIWGRMEIVIYTRKGKKHYLWVGTDIAGLECNKQYYLLVIIYYPTSTLFLFSSGTNYTLF